MKRATLLVTILAVLVAFGLTIQAGEKPKYTYQTLDFPGAVNTWVNVINARGDIAGGYALEAKDIGDGLFLLRNGKFQMIGRPPGSTDVWLNGISETGVLLGAYVTPEPCPGCPFPDMPKEYGMTWSDGTYETVDMPGSAYTSANAMNARGDLVGMTFMNNKNYGFIRTKAGAYSLLDLSDVPGDPMSWSAAWGINDHGDIAGWIGRGDTWEFYAYLLRDGHLTPIPVPESTMTTASSVNNRGEVIILEGITGVNYVWKNGELTPIQVPGATWTSAGTINDEGTVVGSYGRADGTVHGFIATRSR